MCVLLSLCVCVVCHSLIVQGHCCWRSQQTISVQKTMGVTALHQGIAAFRCTHWPLAHIHKRARKHTHPPVRACAYQRLEVRCIYSSKTWSTFSFLHSSNRSHNDLLQKMCSLWPAVKDKSGLTDLFHLVLQWLKSNKTNAGNQVMPFLEEKSLVRYLIFNYFPLTFIIYVYVFFFYLPLCHSLNIFMQ